MFAALVERWEKWRCYQMTVREFLALPDADLADVGFVRKDIRERVRALQAGDPVTRISAGVDDRTGVSGASHRDDVVRRAMLLNLR